MKENEFPKKVSGEVAGLLRHFIKIDLSSNPNGKLKPNDVSFIADG